MELREESERKKRGEEKKRKLKSCTSEKNKIPKINP